jgi:serine/threonine protein kinase
MLQIVDALRYLHSRDILHRDIKLENILISGPDHDSAAKLGDFGLAKVFDGAAIAGTAARTATKCGTPDYMAPEVLQGMSYSVPAEVFSLGVVFYALASAQLPKMVALNVASGEQLNWPEATRPVPQFQSLVKQMLNLYEQDRPPLDHVASCAADLPAAQLLEGRAAQAARDAASTQYPSTGVLSASPSPVQPRRTLPVSSRRGTEPRMSGRSPSEDDHPATAAADARRSADPDAQLRAASGGDMLPQTARHRPAPAAAPPLPPLPPPDVHIISGTEVVLQLRAPIADGDVRSYCVLMQEGGQGGFREVSSVIGMPASGLHVGGLLAGCWYEFKVSMCIRDGSCRAAAASQPVQSCATDLPLLPLWARPGLSRAQSGVRNGSDRSDGSYRASGDLDMEMLAADLNACEVPAWRSPAPSPGNSPLNSRFRPTAISVGQQRPQMPRASSSSGSMDAANTCARHLPTPPAMLAGEAFGGVLHSVQSPMTAAHGTPSLPAALFDPGESPTPPSSSSKHARRIKPWSPAPAVSQAGGGFWSETRARVSRLV